MKALEKSTETSQPILTKLEFTKIFSGIDGLYYLHKDLLQKLKERILSWNENQVIGDLLKILVSFSSLNFSSKFEIFFIMKYCYLFKFLGIGKDSITVLHILNVFIISWFCNISQAGHRRIVEFLQP